MKIIFHAPFASGGSEVQRENALLRRNDVSLIRSPYGDRQPGILSRLIRKAARRLNLPHDPWRENERLLQLVREHKPDAVLVYNSRALRPSTLRKIKRVSGAVLAYFDTDDAVASHNVTVEVAKSFPLWDVFFTQKTFNLGELPQRGVRNVVLSTNIFDPGLHRPMTAEEVGPDFEKYDVVFVGTFEEDRAELLQLLSDAGFSVLVHGNAAGRGRSWERLARAGVTVRPAANGAEYARAVHRGKVALGFLRKLHRDQVTHRSIELPAMGRAMLAEKTDEHDAHLRDGVEYVGFASEEEMVEKARELVADADRRTAIGAAGRARCLSSGYSVDVAMDHILAEIRAVAGGPQPGPAGDNSEPAR